MSQRPVSRSSQGRPPSAARPSSSAGRPPPTSSGRPPGTATRLMTARPGTRSAMTAQGMSMQVGLNVKDRPMTQQGLGGLRTAGGQGPQRMVQDKSYFMGQLRAKITELHNELRKLEEERVHMEKESQNYLGWEKRAEQLARELKNMQGEMGDYNILQDKLNMDASIEELQDDIDALKQQNDREAKNVEVLFQEKIEKENSLKSLEDMVNKEKQQAENLLASMSPDMRVQYENLNTANDELEMQINAMHKQMEDMSNKRADLLEDMSQSTIKQEALKLYERLRVKEKERNRILEEEKSRLTPEEEQEKLLRQVKDDKQKMSQLEKETEEMRERLQQMTADNSGGGPSQYGEDDSEADVAERTQKYHQLRKREEGMDEFLNTFEQQRSADLSRRERLERSIVQLLERQSRSLAGFAKLPTSKEYAHIQADLTIKVGEGGKPQDVADKLDLEARQLRNGIEEAEQLEENVQTETQQLEEDIIKLTKETKIFEDLDGLKNEMEQRKTTLASDRVELAQKLNIRSTVNALVGEYDKLKTSLAQNEDHTQMVNLERKLQHVVQNNYAMQDFIAQKKAESDFTNVKTHVFQQVAEYNKFLQEHVVKYGSAAVSYNQ